MPRKTTGLPGGRALYSGKNAYANQGFENDTRSQLNRLGGLAYAYLAADRVIVTADQTAIVWGKIAAPLGTWQNVFTRGFTLQPDGATLTCNQPGTYRISSTIRILSLPAVTGSAISRVNLSIASGVSLPNPLAIFTNTQAAVSGQVMLSTMPLIVDLQRGTNITFSINNVTGQTMGSGQTTGILLEQLDF